MQSLFSCRSTLEVYGCWRAARCRESMPCARECWRLLMQSVHEWMMVENGGRPAGHPQSEKLLGNWQRLQRAVFIHLPALRKATGEQQILGEVVGDLALGWIRAAEAAAIGANGLIRPATQMLSQAVVEPAGRQVRAVKQRIRHLTPGPLRIAGQPVAGGVEGN